MRFITFLIGVDSSWKRLFQKLFILNFLWKNNLFRWNMRGIKTAQKSFQNFIIIGIFYLFGKIWRITAVLTGTNKKDLNTNEIIFTHESNHIHGFNIGIFHIVTALNRSQSFNTVTQHQRGFIVQTLTRLIHLLREFFLQFSIFSFQKIYGFLHQLFIIFFWNSPHARCRTTLDLIHQARTLPIVKHSITTRTQKKSFLHNVQHAVNSGHAGKRTKIFVFVLAFATIFAQAWKLWGNVYHKVRKSFIIFEQDVIFRLQLFNQLIFHEQSFSLIFHDDKFHPFDLRNHALQTNGQFIKMRISDDSFFDIFGFAHIKHFIIFAEHTVHTGGFGRNFNMSL